MVMRRRLRRPTDKSAELNITAFMNLMVVLVPFLLITAVFSRITILELNLPNAQTAQSKSAKRELQLEVVIRDQALEVGDSRLGLIARIKRGSTGHDYRRLNKVLRQIKSRFPDKTSAMILAESDTSYDTLVQVMDAVRVMEVVEAGSLERYELFPDISIGDAPARGRSKSGGGRKRG